MMDRETSQDKKDGDLLKGISDEEKKSLYDRLDLVEDRLFFVVIRRFVFVLAVLAVLLTVAGFVSWTSVAGSIKEETIRDLVNDAEIRIQVVQGARSRLVEAAGESIDDLTEIVSAATALKEVMIEESREAAVILDNNLDEILEMISQLREELARGDAENEPPE